MTSTTKATALRIKQRTIDFDGEKETIYEVNGCTIVHALYNRKGDWSTWGFVVVSFAGDDNGKVVSAGHKNWAEVRKAARKACTTLWPQHALKHNL